MLSKLLILSCANEPDFLLRTVVWIINFARQKPNLYHLIYLSDSFPNDHLLIVLMKYKSIEKIIDKMVEKYVLNPEICKDILFRCFLLLMGIGTMICVNHTDFSDI